MNTSTTTRLRHVHFGRKGFTLVELLFVMVIISSLMALAMPVTAIVVKQAHSIKCRENLRSILIATTLYGADNNDRFPLIEPDPLGPRQVYPAEAEAKGLAGTLAQYGITPESLECKEDKAQNSIYLTEGTYFDKAGSSYEWIPLVDNEPRSNPRILIQGTTMSPPLNKIVLVVDWENVHSGKKNIGHADGHVETK